ncbi:MAG: response regulator transcription factor [Tenuifilaceae bacterium]
MKIIIVDDNNEFRSTLRFFIEQKLNHEVIADVASGEEFLELDSSLIRDADIVLMDIMMGQINGIETTKTITWRHKNIKIIAVTMHIEKVFLEQIIEAGFKGCVFKSNLFNTLEIALNEVHAGHLFINEQLL